MSRKQQAERLRQLKQREKELEERQLKANFDRLNTMTLGLSKTKGKGVVPKTKVYRRDTAQFPSLLTSSKFGGDSKPRYEGEMLERELKAQEEINRKKSQVGVLVNKSGYQYISEGMDPKTLGRK